MTMVKPAASTATPITDDQRFPHSATTPSVGCDRLDGQCATHQDDHGTTIHRGVEHAVTAGGDSELLSHTLVQWGDDDTPGLQFAGGGEWPQLDLAETDALIRAVEKQLASLQECREHLAVALQKEQLANGTPLAVIRSEWERVVIRHDENMAAGAVAFGSANPIRALAEVHYNRDLTSREHLTARLDRWFPTGRVEYTPEVADVLDAFEAIRRADLDPKTLQFWDEVEQQVIASDDPAGCVAAIAALLTAEVTA